MKYYHPGSVNGSQITVPSDLVILPKNLNRLDKPKNI
jgi:hypothetical protein